VSEKEGSRADAPKGPGILPAYVFFMSHKYLRHRFVNLIAVVCVALSVAILIIVLAVMGGFQSKIREAFQETTSHLVCFLGVPIDYGTEYPSVEKKILAIPHVVGCAPRVRAVAAVAVQGDPVGQWLEIFGIDPKREATATKFKKHLQQVRNPRLAVANPDDPFAAVDLGSNERPRPPILLGEVLYESDRLVRGQTLALAGARIESDPTKPIEKRVQPRELVCATAGAYSTGTFDYDQHNAFLPLDVLLSEFIGSQRASFEIRVQLDDYEKNADAVRDQLEHTVGYRCIVRSWEDLNRSMLGAVDVEKHLIGYVLSLLFILAGGSILSILTMTVIEKTRDIGILKSVGGTVRGVASIFVLNGLTIGVVGSAIGLGLGLLVTFNINWIDTNVVAKIVGHRVFREDIYVFKDIPTRIEPVVIGTIVGAALVVSLLSSLVPAWKAARLNSVESLRYE
jgi:lipoprotein-releasing system permease protein